jgi:ribosomal protein L16 Arg81 hydroxylase
MGTVNTISVQTDKDQSLGDLQHLLGSLSVAEFFADFWNRQAFYMPGHPHKFRGLFDEAAFHRGLGKCEHLKVGYTNEQGWPAHRVIAPAEVLEMLQQGKTVCASSIDLGDAILKDFLKLFRTSFAALGRFLFNSYLSPDGAGFGLHLDHHPVFILQIEGRKRWWYSREPALQRTLTNISFPDDRKVLKLPWVTVTRPPESSLCEVVLCPGDVLYLPKGSWHRAKAIGSSLALTLAMETISPMELVQAGLGPSLNTVELRDPLPGFRRESFEGEMPEELNEIFGAALHQLRSSLASLTPKDLYELWKRS